MQTSDSKPGGGRLFGSSVLLAIAVLVTPMFLVAAWANVEITNTDRYVDTVSSLADNPDVQQYVATELATAFANNVDVTTTLDKILPAALKPLGNTIAKAADGFVATAATRFTASAEFKKLWIDANRAAHKTISRVLTGDLDVAQLEGGALTIDLGDAVRSFQTFLVNDGYEIAGKIDLSGVSKQVVLADGPTIDDIEQARHAVGILESSVWVLGIIALVTAAASVLVAPRKGAALIRLGVGLSLAMGVVAIGVAMAKRDLLSLEGSSMPKPVAGSFYDALVDSLRFGLRSVFILGLVTAILVVITNLPDYGRRWARPTQIAVAALGVLALLADDDLTWGYVIGVLAIVVGALLVLEWMRRRSLRRGQTVDLEPGGLTSYQ